MTRDIARDDLIMVIDALDVWVQLPAQTIARRFLEIGAELVVSAEKHCFPNDDESVRCYECFTDFGVDESEHSPIVRMRRHPHYPIGSSPWSSLSASICLMSELH